MAAVPLPPRRTLLPRHRRRRSNTSPRHCRYLALSESQSRNNLSISHPLICWSSAESTRHSTKPVFLVYIHTYLVIISIRLDIISIRLNNGGQDQIQSRISPQSRDLARTTFISGTHTRSSSTLFLAVAPHPEIRPRTSRLLALSYILSSERERERERER